MNDKEWVEQVDGSWMRRDRRWRIVENDNGNFDIEIWQEYDGWSGFWTKAYLDDAKAHADRVDDAAAPENVWQPKPEPAEDFKARYDELVERFEALASAWKVLATNGGVAGFERDPYERGLFDCATGVRNVLSKLKR